MIEKKVKKRMEKCFHFRDRRRVYFYVDGFFILQLLVNKLCKLYRASSILFNSFKNMILKIRKFVKHVYFFI